MIKDRAMEARSTAILDFWFGGSLSSDDAYPADRAKWWFAGDAATDAAILERFAKDHERAALGKLASWEKSPRTSLALILILDQFSRHLYRDTPRAYEQDAKAVDVCLWGLEQGYDQALRPVERWFYYLPLLHAEDSELQELSVRQFTNLHEAAPAPLKAPLQEALTYALRYRDEIARDGRFKHRDAVLGR